MVHKRRKLDFSLWKSITKLSFMRFPGKLVPIIRRIGELLYVFHSILMAEVSGYYLRLGGYSVLHWSFSYPSNDRAKRITLESDYNRKKDGSNESFTNKYSRISKNRIVTDKFDMFWSIGIYFKKLENLALELCRKNWKCSQNWFFSILSIWEISMIMTGFSNLRWAIEKIFFPNWLPWSKLYSFHILFIRTNFFTTFEVWL